MINQSTGATDLSRTSGRRKLALMWAVLLGLLLPFVVFTSTISAAPAGQPAHIVSPTFLVNAESDFPGAAPLDDGVCATAYHSGQPNGVCTLRAAIMEANHWPGDVPTIILPALPAGHAYALKIAGAGLDDESTGDLNITADERRRSRL